MLRHLTTALVLLPVMPVAWGADPTPAQQYKALVKQYEDEWNDYTKAERAAESDEQRRLLLDRMPDRDEYAARFMELAETYPGHPVAVDALGWVAENCRLKPFRAGHELQDKALAILLRDHVHDERLAALCVRLRDKDEPAIGEFLRAVMKDTKSDVLRAEACLSLVHYLDRRVRLVRSFQEEPDADPGRTVFRGQDFAGELRAADPAKIDAQGEELVRELAERYTPRMTTDKVCALCREQGRQVAQWRGVLLRLLREKDTREDVRGEACLALAAHQRRRAEFVRRLKDDPERESVETRRLGDEVVEGWRTADAGAIEARGEQLLREFAERHAPRMSPERVCALCREHATEPARWVSSLLRQLLEKGEAAEVRGEACLALARHFEARADLIRWLKDDPEWAAVSARMLRMSKEDVEEVRDSDTGKARAESERLVREFAEKQAPRMTTERVCALCGCYGSDLTATARNLPRLLSNDGRRRVRAEAYLTLAQQRARLANRIRVCRDNPELLKHMERHDDKEVVKEVRTLDPAEVDGEAVALLGLVVADYADVERAPGQKYGDPAGDWLFALTRLVPGKPAPEVEGEDQDGKKLKLSDYKGKVVLLDFWTRAEPYARLSHWEDKRSLAKRMEGRPFAIVGVETDGGEPRQLREAMEKEKLTWRSFADPARQAGAGVITRKWILDGLAKVYLIDHEGVIRHRWAAIPRPDVLDKCVEPLVRAAEAAAKRPPK